MSPINKNILEEIFNKIESFTVYINSQLNIVSDVFKSVNYQIINEEFVIIR